jgi:hypothetical protein
LIIAFLVLKNTVFFLLIKLFKPLIKMITCGVCESEDKECGSHCFYQELKVKALKALYEKTCAEVKNFGEISGKGLGKNSFADHRHEEEPTFDFDTMLKTLKNK